jgi:hypothetical protein
MTANAQADSLLGQLQRGRGSGFLRALQEDVAVVRPLVLDCVTHDPRWDGQLEDRSSYYATLIMQITLPLDPFDAFLRTCSENNLLDSEYILLDTLCALARRGDLSAVAVLRAYLTYGNDWYKWRCVFETLMEVPSASVSVDEVSHIIDQRFHDDDTLDDELPYVPTKEEPWRSLRLVNPHVSRILRRREMEEEHRQQQEKQVQVRFASLPISELLAVAVDSDTLRFADLELQKRVTIADLDLLLHVAQQGERWQRRMAFRGLERLAHPAALPTLQRFFESPDPDAQPGSGALYGAAVRAIKALPSNVTLDLARAWFDEPDSPHRHVALMILEAHATYADVYRVRNALLPSLWRDTEGTSECYMQCSMLKILARFPRYGPYPEVETVFEEANYARVRIYAAQVLTACNRDQFSHGLAFECLWDSEEEVRLIGCDSVSLDMPDARAKLQALSSDPHEDKEIRNAAKERLAAVKPLREHMNRDGSEED